MTSSLVGSEMCIRDRRRGPVCNQHAGSTAGADAGGWLADWCPHNQLAVSYTHLTLPTICSV
eukprot:5153993-Prorocentrum_lima.AAC.1